jgi:hypothetical protein|tara:strand:- start:485 stop:1027 length:543 start_codon:yes stop_codon:yes gene_type:complete
MDFAAIKNPTAEYCETMMKVRVKIRSKTPITFPALGISLSLETCISVALKTSLIKMFAGFKHTKYPVIMSKYLKFIEKSNGGLIPCHLSNKTTTKVRIAKWVAWSIKKAYRPKCLLLLRWRLKPSIKKWVIAIIPAANAKLSCNENNQANKKHAKPCQYKKELLNPIVFFCFANLSVWKK